MMHEQIIGVPACPVCHALSWVYENGRTECTTPGCSGPLPGVEAPDGGAQVHILRQACAEENDV